MKRRAILFGAGCALAASSALALRPRTRAAEIFEPVKLEDQVPVTFDGWTVDRSIIPVLPDPSVQARLDAIYNQVLARTYVNGTGQRVMLSIAYGADQGSDSTSVHRPEFCYSAQGFIVRSLGETNLALNDHSIVARRLLGRLGARVEPITYWITLNDRALMPGLQRKLEQIRLGLTGLIPDGMLFRMSTVGLQQEQSFALQDTFAVSMESSMEPALRSRYFGRA